MRPTKLPENLFRPLLDHDQSWLLGLIFTDGNLYSTSNTRSQRLSITSTDEDVIRKVLNIARCGKINSRQPKYLNSKIRWDWRISSIHFDELLSPFCITPRKSKTVQFPDISLLSLPDFVRGLWDGDGSLRIEKSGILRSYFCSASDKFIFPLSIILNSINDSKSIPCLCNTNNIYYLRYASLKSKALLDWMYSGSNENNRMNRKYEIYLSINT